MSPMRHTKSRTALKRIYAETELEITSKCISQQISSVFTGLKSYPYAYPYLTERD